MINHHKACHKVFSKNHNIHIHTQPPPSKKTPENMFVFVVCGQMYEIHQSNTNIPLFLAVIDQVQIQIQIHKT